MNHTNKPRPSTLRLLLAAALLPCMAHAGHGTSGDSLDILEQENNVFSASRYVQTMSETPANVTIITHEELMRFGYRSVNEALKSLVGVYDAASQWPALGVRGMAVPGDFGSRILYLINGMPVYEPTYGGFFIEAVDIQSIERIEFVKGAGSALYGSGAVLAVVNLITKSGRGGAKTVAVETGSDDSIKLYGARGELRTGGVETFVSASAARSNGRNIYLREFDNPAYDQARYGGVSAGNDSLRNARLFARMAYEDAWLQGIFVTADKRDPLASYDTIFNGRLMLKEQLGAIEAGFNRDLGEGAKTVARAYFVTASEKGDYPYSFSGGRVPPADYINVTDLASRQFGAELRYDRFFSSGHRLLAGIEVKRISSDQAAGDQPDASRSGVLTVNRRPSYGQWALFLQDEFRLGPGKLFLGARFDSYSGFSEGVRSRLSPRIAYVHDVSPATTVKLIYGEAYRAPTVYESRYQDGVPAASTLWENPKLRPELARTVEALLEHEPRKGMKWRLSGFLNRLKDSPVQVVTPVVDGYACLLGPDACNQYRNSGGAQEVVGIEADVRIRHGDRNNFYGSAVLQHARTAGQEPASSPARQFKAGYGVALPWRDTDASLELHHIGKVRGRIEAGGTRTASAPGYLLVNAAFHAARVAGNWHVSIRATNLLDKAIYTIASRELQPVERVPAPGRGLSLQMRCEY